jgi:L,D-transpeptidase ErfK/SrfK
MADMTREDRLYRKPRPLVWLVVLAGLLAGARVHASGAEYVLPTNGDNVVGFVTTAIAQHEDTMFDVGRRYGVGYEEVIAANPGIDPWLPGAGTEILIPTNLPEHRLYYYPPGKPGEPRVVRTYPISTGKMDWKTPLGVTRIVAKQHLPNWYPPKSVLEEHEQRGDPLPRVVRPGPDNPLGEHAMRLGIPGGAYLIHGTNRPTGVGMQVTHGCIRMYPEDIEELFGLVGVNTRVNLIDQTTKVGWQRGTLFVERHAPLEGTNDPAHDDPAEMTRLLGKASEGRSIALDWPGAERAFLQATGVPVPLSIPVRAVSSAGGK